VDVAAIPAVRGTLAALLAAEEYQRFAALVDELDDAEWSRPTDCDAWDVRALVSHVVGATEGHTSLREQLHQLRAGREGFAVGVDAVSAVQVRERRDLEPDDLRRRLRAALPAAVRRRTRFARLGPVPFPVGAPVHERWRSDYLFAVIYTRDTWLHRVDVARATGRPLVLTADHDGRIVADVVVDWARRHGEPFRLELLGPAGGSYATAIAGPELRLDAVELCRILSGRAAGDGLLATPVPF